MLIKHIHITDKNVCLLSDEHCKTVQNKKHGNARKCRVPFSVFSNVN